MHHRLYFLIILSFFISRPVVSQEFGDAEQYLIDSLDLKKLTATDRSLIDSLLDIYHNCPSDTCKVNAISTIVEESWDDNVWPLYNHWILDFTKRQLVEQIDSLTELFMRKAYAGALNNVGYFHNIRGEIEEAINYYEQGLVIQKELNDREGIAGTLINLGYIYLNQGFIEKALENYYSSLALYEQLSSESGIALALNGIGYIYYKQGDTENAVNNFTRSLEIRKKLNDQYGIATCLNNLGLVYRDDGQWDEALENFVNGMEIEKQIGDNSGVEISLGNIGYVYNQKGEYNLAIEYFFKSLKIRQELDHMDGTSLILNGLANAYFGLGNLAEAKKYALQSINKAIEIQYPANIKNAAETLMKIAKKQEQWKEAFNYQTLYNQMKDSVFNQETVSATIQQEFKYKYEKKALADSIKNADRERIAEAILLATEAENEQLKTKSLQQRQFLYFLIAVLVLFIIFSLILYNRIKIILKQKRLISAQKLRVEDQRKQLNEYVNEIEKKKQHLEHLNNELKQFAHIVSHDLKAPLRGITQAVSLIESDFQHQLTGELKEYFKIIKERSIKSQQLITGILEYSEAGSTKKSFGSVNTAEMVENIIRHTPNPKEIKIKVKEVFPMVTANPIQLDQIFSNLISNAIKYNHRKKGEGVLEMSHQVNGKFYKFTLSDNGPGVQERMKERIFQLFHKGKDNPNMLESSGIGLAIVKKLINQNGGKIWVEKNIHGGASFIFEWPVDNL